MPVSVIEKDWPIESWRDCHVVVAVSGGADSVALLRALHQIRLQSPGKGQLVVAHFNHLLRGDDSDADEAWVVQLAQTLDLECRIDRAPPTGGCRTEESARSARYAFLQQTAAQLGARYVATAHSADDQIETVLMRVLRGSGIDGLAGIPRYRPLTAGVTLVRPLLEVRREQIEQYLQDLGQDYRTDASNKQSHFTRNWLRNQLLPQLRDRLPSDPDRSLLRLAEQATQWSEFMQGIVDPLLSQAVQVCPQQLVFDTRLLSDQPTLVLQELARGAWRAAGWPEQAMGMAEWKRVAEAMLNKDTPTFTLPGSISARRTQDALTLTHINQRTY